MDAPPERDGAPVASRASRWSRTVLLVGAGVPALATAAARLGLKLGPSMRIRTDSAYHYDQIVVVTWILAVVLGGLALVVTLRRRAWWTGLALCGWLTLLCYLVSGAPLWIE